MSHEHSWSALTRLMECEQILLDEGGQSCYAEEPTALGHLQTESQHWT